MAAAVNADAVTVISRLPQSAGLLAEQIASGEYAAHLASVMALDAVWGIDPDDRSAAPDNYLDVPDRNLGRWRPRRGGARPR